MLSSRSLTRTTAGRSSRRSRISSSARWSPVEIAVPALNVSRHGLRGGSGSPPPVLGGTRKKRTNGRSSAASVPGGSAMYAVSEKRTSPYRPFESASRSSVASDPVVRLRRDARRDVEHDDRGRVDGCERGRWSGRSASAATRSQAAAPSTATSAISWMIRVRRAVRRRRLASESGMALDVLTADRSRRGRRGRRPPLRRVVDVTRRHGRRSWRALPPRASSPPARGALPPDGGPGSVGPATPAGAERRARSRPPPFGRYARDARSPSRRGRPRPGRARAAAPAASAARRPGRGEKPAGGISVCRRYFGSRAATTAAGTRGTTAIDTVGAVVVRPSATTRAAGSGTTRLSRPGTHPGPRHASRCVRRTSRPSRTTEEGPTAWNAPIGARMRASRASPSESRVARTT